MRKIIFFLMALCVTAYGQTPLNSTTGTTDLQGETTLKPLKVGDEFKSQVQTAHPYNTTGVMGFVFEKQFYSKHSSYIKLYFKNFDLAPGDYLEIAGVNNGNSIIYAGQGKIIDANGTMISDFWSQAILDERIVVRLYSANASNHYGFDIDRVAYGYPQSQIDAMLRQKSICGTDDKEQIICYDTTVMYDRGRAVCRLLMNGSTLCTGWLLGSQGHVMTNNHCVGNSSTAANTDFLFDFEAPNCDGTGINTGVVEAASSTLISTSASLDYTLLQLPTNLTSTYGFLQLSPDIPNVGDRIYIVGHPGGRRKEISVVTDQGGDPNGNAMVNTSSVNGVRYFADTEGGSSGSPVFDFNSNFVIAIHNTGGCTNGSFGRCDQLIAHIGSNMPLSGIGSFPPPPNCSTTITNFPHEESFESSFGDWRNSTGNDLDWLRNSGSTPTNGTGPNSAADGSFYAYINSSTASNPYFPNQDAVLVSPCFDLNGLNNPTLSFRYHMSGAADLGVLRAEVSTNGAHWTTIWIKSGDQGNSWQTAMVSLSNYNSEDELKVRFHATTNGTPFGDIAIDQVRLYENNSSACANYFPYNEGFESDFGGWSNPTVGDDFDWTRQSGSTPTSGTGPSAASSGSFYAYMESSAPNNPSKHAILDGPCFDLRQTNNPSLRFSYHMYGSSNLGSLSLQASTNGNTWTTIWSKSGNQGNSWKTTTVDLNSYTNATSLQLRFYGITGSDGQGDIAIDRLVGTGFTFFPESQTTNVNRLEQAANVAPIFSPNPFKDAITIHKELEGSSNYRLLNLQGQVVRAGTFTGNTIPLKDLQVGVYLLSITNNEHQFVEKIIKQ